MAEAMRLAWSQYAIDLFGITPVMSYNAVMRPLALLLTLTAVAFSHTTSNDWPSTTIAKKLYAKNDFRSKAAPKIVVEKWLNDKEPITKDKVVIVDFWATWCPPCRATIPDLNKLAAKFKDDVVVIGISDEKPEVVRDFMKKTEMTYNVGIDTKSTNAKAVGVEGIPHVLVISADGIVRWQGFPLDENDPLTEDVVAKIVAASKATVQPAGGKSSG